MSGSKMIRVLVAEDDEVNAKAANFMLRQLGCWVDVVENGSDAVDCFHKRDYDLILMDLQMPFVNGIEATTLIRAHARGEATPIVGTTSGNAHAECIRAGMNDVVPKPFLLEKMRYMLARWTSWTEPAAQAPKV
jgi:CheY-like chemotaxis protein